MAACPDPETAMVKSLLVWNVYLSHALTSSIARSISGCI